MDSNDLDKVTSDVEKDLLEIIIEKLKENKLTPEESRALAKEFLSHLPAKDFPALVDLLKQISIKYASVREVYVKYYAIQGDMNDAVKLHAMAGHINEGNIEKALEVAKGGLNG